MIPKALQLAKVPFALFFPPQDFGDKITLCGRLRDAADGALDGEPLILPMPTNGPPDLPRIQLESRDKSYILQISLRRFTLEWNRRTQEPSDWASITPRFFNIVEGVLRVFIGEYAKPNRFALNPQFFHLMQRSANDYLSTYVLQPDRVIDKPASCKISVLDQLNVNGRAMNLWMNISSANNQEKPAEDTGLVIHFDFNSAAEDQRQVSTDDIMEAMARASDLMDRRMRTFFNDLFSDGS